MVEDGRARPDEAYATDNAWAEAYLDYQRRYAEEPRYSDLELTRLLIKALHEMSLGRPARILDIGCSTGNLLRLIKRSIPQADLVGGDLMVEAVEQCRRDPQLGDAHFDVMDIVDLPTAQFDVVIANAVTVLLDDPTYLSAARSMAESLLPSGVLITFDWVFLDDRSEQHTEVSAGHPEGLMIWFRNRAFVQERLLSVGFRRVDVIPFNAPVDLPIATDGLDAELRTRTRLNEFTGFREQFRGDLYQPWAHVVAWK